MFIDRVQRHEAIVYSILLFKKNKQTAKKPYYVKCLTMNTHRVHANGNMYFLYYERGKCESASNELCMLAL